MRPMVRSLSQTPSLTSTSMINCWMPDLRQESHAGSQREVETGTQQERGRGKRATKGKIVSVIEDATLGIKLFT